jgi:hypothetical protein
MGRGVERDTGVAWSAGLVVVVAVLVVEVVLIAEAVRTRTLVLFFPIPYATTRKGSARRRDGAYRVAEVYVELPSLSPDGEPRRVWVV